MKCPTDVLNVAYLDMWPKTAKLAPENHSITHGMTNSQNLWNYNIVPMKYDHG